MNTKKSNKEIKNLNKKRLAFLTLFVVFMCAALAMMGAISAASVDNSTGADSNPGTDVQPVKTIQNGIQKTSNNGEVILNGKFKGSGNVNITIDKNITIKSKDKNNKAILDAENKNWFFRISKDGTRVTFQDIIFINSKYSAIDARGQYTSSFITLNIVNCTFENNHATYDFPLRQQGSGGAIIMTVGSLNIDNSRFINNSADGEGGAIHAWDDFSRDRNTGFSVNINNSVFADNFLSTDQTGIRGGGAICVWGVLNVNNSNFTKNKADWGGAISLSNGRNATIVNSLFEDNSAAIDGGAISYHFGGTYHNEILIDNSTFKNNTAGQYGGAIYNCANNRDFNYETIGYYLNNTSMKVVNSNFIDNSADIAGGAIYNYGGKIPNNIALWSNLTVIGSNFSQNKGGAIGTTSTHLYLYSNNISNNDIGVWFNLKNDEAATRYSNQDYFASEKMRDNIIANNGIGFEIVGYNVTYQLPTVENNDKGIVFGDNANNNTLISPIIINNRGTGLEFGSDTYGNKVSNGTIVNNGKAILLNGTNNTVNRSNIYNNKDEISIFGNNNTLTYNRIFNNTRTTGFDMTNKGVNTNANLNWWGENFPKIFSSDSDAVKYWYVIQLSANDFKTRENASRNHNAGDAITLTYEFITNEEVDNDANLLPYFEVRIIGENGAIISKDIRNSQYSYNVIGSIGESYKIGGISDNENVLLTVNIPGSPVPPEGPENPTPGPKDNGTEEPTPVPTPTPSPNPKDNGTEPTSPAKSNIPVGSAAMKQTGIPFVLLVLAILSVFGVAIRRK